LILKFVPKEEKYILMFVGIYLQKRTNEKN